MTSSYGHQAFCFNNITDKVIQHSITSLTSMSGFVQVVSVIKPITSISIVALLFDLNPQLAHLNLHLITSHRSPSLLHVHLPSFPSSSPPSSHCDYPFHLQGPYPSLPRCQLLPLLPGPPVSTFDSSLFSSFGTRT